MPTAEKILAEGRAGRVQADIFDGIANMLPLEEAGLLSPFSVPNEAEYPAQLKAKDGYWTAVIMYVFTPGINTTLLPKNEAPKTFADLLDPRLKGKMAWNGSSMAGAYGFVANILTTMGEQKGMAYLKALAAQRVVNVEASSRAVLDQVIAGEYAMNLMAFNHHVMISARKGAPVDWLKLEPAPVMLDALLQANEQAPHPHAAQLLLDFLLSTRRTKCSSRTIICRRCRAFHRSSPGCAQAKAASRLIFYGPTNLSRSAQVAEGDAGAVPLGASGRNCGEGEVNRCYGGNAESRTIAARRGDDFSEPARTLQRVRPADAGRIGAGVFCPRQR